MATTGWMGRVMGPALAAALAVGAVLSPAAQAATAEVIDAITTAPMTRFGAMSPDGKRAYYAMPAQKQIAVIDTKSNSVVGTLPTIDEPSLLTVSPDGKRLYITIYKAGIVSVINTATNLVVKNVTVGSGPGGIRVSPDGTRIYVALAEGKIAVVNASTLEVLTAYPVAMPLGIDTSPDGSRLYVTHQAVKVGVVSVLDASTGTVIQEITPTPGHLAMWPSVTPDGKFLFVTNGETGPENDAVAVIDTTTYAVVKKIPVGNGPLAISMSAAGRRAYVANAASDSVSVIDLVTQSVVATVAVGKEPWTANVTLDGTKVFAANGAAGTISVIDTGLRTVTFAANGGTGVMKTQSAFASTPLTPNFFVRPGFTFGGWNTKADGKGVAYVNKAAFDFGTSMTLYAQWKQAEHTVTFKANGGTGTMAPQKASKPTQLSKNAFKRAGHTFAGWNTKADGKGAAYANQTVYPFLANVTLYAQWKK